MYWYIGYLTKKYVFACVEGICVCELGGGGAERVGGGVAERKGQLTERLFSSLVTWQIIYI